MSLQEKLMIWNNLYLPLTHLRHSFLEGCNNPMYKANKEQLKKRKLFTSLNKESGILKWDHFSRSALLKLYLVIKHWRLETWNHYLNAEKSSNKSLHSFLLSFSESLWQLSKDSNQFEKVLKLWSQMLKPFKNRNFTKTFHLKLSSRLLQKFKSIDYYHQFHLIKESLAFNLVLHHFLSQV